MKGSLDAVFVENFDQPAVVDLPVVVAHGQRLDLSAGIAV